MTKIEQIHALLHTHYANKQFTALDVAAKVGAHRDYVSKVLQEIRGVKLMEEAPAPSPRGGYTLNKMKIYTFKPTSTDKWVA